MSPSTPSQEKRTFTRVTFDADAILRQNATEWKTQVVDLSFKGVMIKDKAPLSLHRDKPAEIIIRLDNETRISMEVFWVHDDDDHCGFRCSHIDLESMAHLRRLVELNMANQELLEREMSQLIGKT